MNIKICLLIIHLITTLDKAEPVPERHLDNFAKPYIIKTIIKDCDEDEYAPSRRYREQDERVDPVQQVRTCPYSSAKWTSELQGERFREIGIPVTRAGAAAVIQAKGIAPNSFESTAVPHE